MKVDKVDVERKIKTHLINVEKTKKKGKKQRVKKSKGSRKVRGGRVIEGTRE